MSNDFVVLDEGAQYLAGNGKGLPNPCYFLLSEKPANGYVAGSHLATGLIEINTTHTCTGYSRQSQAAPTPVGNAITFASMTWNTGSATDWSNNVQTIAMTTTVDNSGVAICAWNLVPSLTPPALTPVSVSSTGGSGAAGVYYWLLVAQNATGAQAAGASYSTYMAANSTITFSWSPVSGATAYILYKATTSAGLFDPNASKIATVTSPYTADPGASTSTPGAQTLNTTNGYLDMSTAGYSLTMTPSLTTTG